LDEIIENAGSNAKKTSIGDTKAYIQVAQHQSGVVLKVRNEDSRTITVKFEFQKNENLECKSRDSEEFKLMPNTEKLISFETIDMFQKFSFKYQISYKLLDAKIDESFLIRNGKQK